MEDGKLDERTLTRLTEHLTHALGTRRYATWFQSQVDYRVAAGGELQVLVATPLERDHLQRRFASEIGAAYTAACGQAKPVAFRIVDPAAASDRLGRNGPGSEAAGPGGGGADGVANEHAAGPTLKHRVTEAAQAAEAAAPPPPGTLEALVVGEANQAAVTVARQVAAGVFPASPLLLWGATGVGKTQLLRGIQDEVRRTRRCRAVYLTAEQFLSGFVAAVHERGLPSFRYKHRGVDLLILDDVQMLLGKKKTLEELQYTLDALVASGSQVVLGADRGPAELAPFGRELVSRLSAGVAVEVEPPDTEMRRRLLDRLAAERGVVLEPAARDAVANGVLGSARELSGVVNRLRYETGLLGDPVDEDLARRVAAEVNRQSTPRVKLPEVLGAVCRVFGVEASLLKSGARTKAASEPRMLAMWLARKHTRSAWSEIGDFFGKRRHSTVISACKRVDKLIQNGLAVRLDGGECTVQESLRRVETELRTA